jgi:hypothetical protein
MALHSRLNIIGLVRVDAADQLHKLAGLMAIVGTVRVDRLANQIQRHITIIACLKYA